jgi:DNA-binding response OmpR family regulator
MMEGKHMKILIVDDEENILEIVEAYLVAKNYQVFRAMDGEEALRKAETIRPDLIVLDLMLPDISGLEVCRRIRKSSSVPVIMLTARTTEQDILSGLQIGADHYMTKPFSPKELVARVQTVLRRSHPEPQEVKWSFEGGLLEIYPDNMQELLPRENLLRM